MSESGTGIQREVDVVVVGGANTDYVVRGEELAKPGATAEGSEFLEAPGGKGANQAVGVARLGGRTALIACVGSDERGRALMTSLEAAGVDVRYVRRDPDAASGVALVMVNARGEKQIMTAPGANHRLMPADIERARDAILNTRVLLAQLEVPMETVEASIRLARSSGAVVVLDPAPARPISERLLHDVHVIRPNASEAEVLTGVEVSNQSTARQAATNLMERGVGAAIIGAPDGDLLLSADEELWLRHLPVEAVDSTGAGDAFAAALALSLARGVRLTSAARFASAAAAAKTTRLGAQAGMPDREAVERLLARAG